jgi:hypothetical protein
LVRRGRHGQSVGSVRSAPRLGRDRDRSPTHDRTRGAQNRGRRREFGQDVSVLEPVIPSGLARGPDLAALRRELETHWCADTDLLD